MRRWDVNFRNNHRAPQINFPKRLSTLATLTMHQINLTFKWTRAIAFDSPEPDSSIVASMERREASVCRACWESQKASFFSHPETETLDHSVDVIH